MSSSEKDFNKMSEDDLKTLLCASQKPESRKMFSQGEIESMSDALYKLMGPDAFHNWSIEVEKNG